MIADQNDHLYELGWLENHPVVPARQGHYGEAVYLEGWQFLLAVVQRPSSPPNEKLAIILDNMGELTQRHATVAASFIMWLGTNVGMGLLSEMRRAAHRDNLPARAFLHTWAWSNRRHHGVNGGFRHLEYILAPADHFGQGINGPYTLLRLPELSADDYETVDCLVMWLASEEAQKMLAVWDLEITERQDEHNMRDRLRHSRGAQ